MSQEYKQPTVSLLPAITISNRADKDRCISSLLESTRLKNDSHDTIHSLITYLDGKEELLLCASTSAELRKLITESKELDSLISSSQGTFAFFIARLSLAREDGTHIEYSETPNIRKSIRRYFMKVFLEADL